MEGFAAPALTHLFLFFKSFVLVSQLGAIGKLRCQASAFHWHPYKYSAFLVISCFYFLVAFLPFLLTFPVPCTWHTAGCPACFWLAWMSAADAEQCSLCCGETGWTPHLGSLGAWEQPPGTSKISAVALAALKYQYWQYTNANQSSGVQGWRTTDWEFVWTHLNLGLFFPPHSFLSYIFLEFSCMENVNFLAA